MTRLEPVMEQAINAYYTITSESEFREQERLWAKARHDEAQALYHAEEKGKLEGKLEGQQAIIDLLKRGKSPEEIIREYES